MRYHSYSVFSGGELLEELLGGLLEKRADQVQGGPKQQLRKQIGF